MLMPKKVKYRKQQRGRMRGLAWRGSTVSFGDFGLMALEPCWLTDRQIEAARVALTRGIKRGGKVWIRVFPDKPVTKKPQETRMGKGKGAPEGWVAVIKPGRILFEMEGVSVSGSARGDAAGVGEAADEDALRDALCARSRCHEGAGTADGVARADASTTCRQRARELDDQVFRLRLQQSMGQAEAGQQDPAAAPRAGAREDRAAREGRQGLAMANGEIIGNGRQQQDGQERGRDRRAPGARRRSTASSCG